MRQNRVRVRVFQFNFPVGTKLVKNVFLSREHRFTETPWAFDLKDSKHQPRNLSAASDCIFAAFDCILRRAAPHWIRSLVTGLTGDGVSKVMTARLLTPLLEGLFKLYGLINSCLGAFLETGPEPSKSGPSLKLCPPHCLETSRPPTCKLPLTWAEAVGEGL